MNFMQEEPLLILYAMREGASQFRSYVGSWGQNSYAVRIETALWTMAGKGEAWKFELNSYFELIGE